MKPRLQSKLILMEGLPSTGKSTNSQTLRTQLERNGIPARWIHEVARPHPTLFFNEACLTEKDYVRFLAKYPDTAELLGAISIKRKRTIGIDLLELEWNHLGAISEEALRELKTYDVWNFPLDQYIEVAIEKWECFVERARTKEDVFILDSAIFQFQIYTFLLKKASFEKLLEFVQRLYKMIEPLNPIMIYLQREEVEETINYLEEVRGVAFFEHIWERDHNLPYYVGRPQGAEGYREFLRDYDRTAKKLYAAFPYKKISIDITEQTWDRYTEKLLAELGLTDQKPFNDEETPTGTFFNQELGQYVEIKGGLFVTPQGHRKRLISRGQNEFYLQDLPMTIRVESDTVTIEGEQLIERWTTRGTVFLKVD